MTGTATACASRSAATRRSTGCWRNSGARVRGRLVAAMWTKPVGMIPFDMTWDSHGQEEGQETAKGRRNDLVLQGRARPADRRVLLGGSLSCSGLPSLPHTAATVFRLLAVLRRYRWCRD